MFNQNSNLLNYKVALNPSDNVFTSICRNCVIAILLLRIFVIHQGMSVLNCSEPP